MKRLMLAIAATAAFVSVASAEEAWFTGTIGIESNGEWSMTPGDGKITTIITTPVGAAPQILSRFPGESIHDVLELRASLTRLIDKTDPAIAAPSAEAIEEMSWNSRIKPLVNLLK